MSASEAWTRLVRSIDDVSSRAALASLDLAALDALTPAERASAEVLLGRRLRDGPPDPRVSAALIALGSDAPQALVREGETWDAVRVAAAVAWWEAERHPDAALALIDALRSAPSPRARLAALAVVETLDDADADEALIDAAATAPETAAVCVRAWVRRRGWEGHSHPPSPLSTLAMRLGCAIPSVRASAEIELRRLAAGASSGRSAEELGIVVAGGDPYALERVRASVADGAARWRNEIDVDALIGLSGADRRWAEELLLARLGTCDPRVPPALAWLGTRAAVIALRELDDQGSPAFRAAAAAALDSLGGRA